MCALVGTNKGFDIVNARHNHEDYSVELLSHMMSDIFKMSGGDLHDFTNKFKDEDFA